VKTPIQKESDRKRLDLKVVNASGVEIYFKVSRTTKLSKLMDAYCKKQGLVPGSVRFTFDGNRLNPESTGEELDMDNGDTIDAMVEQTGGWCFL